MNTHVDRPAGKAARPDAGPLGLDAAKPIEIHETIRIGLTYKSMALFAKQMGLPLGTVGALIAIPASTLARRKGAELLKPDESDRLYRLARLFRLAVDFFRGDAPAAVRWMQTPRPALGGHPPLELAKTDVGVRQVETLIDQLRHGVVV